MKNTKLHSTKLQIAVDDAARRFADVMDIDLSKADIRVGDARGKGTRSEKPAWAKIDHLFHRTMDWKNTETGEKKYCHILPVDVLLDTDGDEDARRTQIAYAILDAVLHCSAAIATQADVKNFPPIMSASGRHNKAWVAYCQRFGILYGAEDSTSDSAGYCYLRAVSKTAGDAVEYVKANFPAELLAWIADIEKSETDGDTDGDGSGGGKKKFVKESFMVGCSDETCPKSIGVEVKTEKIAEALRAWADTCPKCGKMTVITKMTGESAKTADNTGTSTVAPATETEPEEKQAETATEPVLPVLGSVAA